MFLSHCLKVFLFTYDMTNMVSLNELRKWVTIVYSISEAKRIEPSVALIGSKGDLEHLRTVRLDAHTRFAQEFSIHLSFLLSAKSGESVSFIDTFTIQLLMVIGGRFGNSLILTVLRYKHALQNVLSII